MFELLLTDPKTKARRGRLTTSHGIIETPVLGTIPLYIPNIIKASASAIISTNINNG